MKLITTQVIDTDFLIESLAEEDYEDVVGFVGELDLAIADIEFTETLIVMLLKSLQGSYGTEQDVTVAKLLEATEECFK